MNILPDLLWGEIMWYAMVAHGHWVQVPMLVLPSYYSLLVFGQLVLKLFLSEIISNRSQIQDFWEARTKSPTYTNSTV